jgi:hypothetical protein
MRLVNVRAHLGLLSAVAVLLGLHPFGNQLGVTSEPFEQSLSVSNQSTEGHDRVLGSGREGG